ncbi:MAG: hypothetical protein QOI14_1529, partial [Actinomycetota bacterium]|nr:hypothetical protein [Actinomycetota bacterium]
MKKQLRWGAIVATATLASLLL